MSACMMPKEEKRTGFRLIDPGQPLERILRTWGMEDIRQESLFPRSVAYASLERMAIVSGTLSGTIVLRSSLEFAHQLRDRQSASALGRYNSEEVFEELAALYGLYLFHDFWNAGPLHIQPVRPFRSVPSDWPFTEPHASCLVRAEGFPVEVRLWMKD